MIKITAPICFDIKERLDNNENIGYIYEQFKPTKTESDGACSVNTCRKPEIDCDMLLCVPRIREQYGKALERIKSDDEYKRICEKVIRDRETEIIATIFKMNALEYDRKELMQLTAENKSA